MRYPVNFDDYELIDCSCGEKIERWKREILVRPDPQIIWKTPKTSLMWSQPSAIYHRSNSGGGKWKVFKRMPDAWQIRFQDMTLNVKTMGFKHTGVFPEQAVNWEFQRNAIKATKRNDIKVLNLFAYTGAATVACLKEGASVVHVDSSKGMTNWAKENAKSSGVEDSNVRWIIDDCIKFAKREIRRGNKYDIIILDPPSYGRGPKGEIWHLEDSIYEMLELVEQLISDDPLFVMLNSYTTGLSPSVMTYIMQNTIATKRRGFVVGDEVGLPVSSNLCVLPCGATTVWISDKYKEFEKLFNDGKDRIYKI